MPAYRGTNVEVSFNSQVISGDGRSVSYSETAETHDTTAYGDANRTKIPGLLDGSGSFEALDVTGAWATVWQTIQPGDSATMVVYPEGNSSGNRSASFTAIITDRTISMPYDDLATISMSFEISGAVTEATVA